MAIDTEAKKIELWANTGDRLEPSDVGIDESLGWTVGYEQQGSGLEPEREVFNTLVRRITGWWLQWLRHGVLPYDADLVYDAGAFVNHSEKLWRCIQQNGSGYVVVEPGTDNDFWRLY